MVRMHYLKTWPEFFQAILSGDKTFEFRSDDRGFMLGDRLALEHYDPGRMRGSGRQGDYIRVGSFGSPETIFARVTYIIHGGRMGIPERFCVMAIRVESQNFTTPPDEHRPTLPARGAG